MSTLSWLNVLSGFLCGGLAEIAASRLRQEGRRRVWYWLALPTAFAAFMWLAHTVVLPPIREAVAPGQVAPDYTRAEPPR